MLTKTGRVFGGASRAKMHVLASVLGEDDLLSGHSIAATNGKVR